jgi:hypothetical protein
MDSGPADMALSGCATSSTSSRSNISRFSSSSNFNRKVYVLSYNDSILHQLDSFSQS